MPGRARSFWAARQDRLKKAFSQVFRADERGQPERAFMDVFAMGTEGYRANANALRGVKSSLRPEEWGEVVSEVVRRMGVATPGAQDAAGEVFSPATFVTNWNRLSPEAKALFFDGKALPNGFRGQMDALVRVVERGKDAGAQLNKSRSGSVMGNLAVGSALGSAGASMDPAAILTAGAAAIGANATARLMTQPRFLRALRSYYETGTLDGLIRLANSNYQAAPEVGAFTRAIAAQREGGSPAATPRLPNE